MRIEWRGSEHFVAPRQRVNNEEVADASVESAALPACCLCETLQLLQAAGDSTIPIALSIEDATSSTVET
jgi:hypothetical protein